MCAILRKKDNYWASKVLSREFPHILLEVLPTTRGCFQKFFQHLLQGYNGWTPSLYPLCDFLWGAISQERLVISARPQLLMQSLADFDHMFLAKDRLKQQPEKPKPHTQHPVSRTLCETGSIEKIKGLKRLWYKHWKSFVSLIVKTQRHRNWCELTSDNETNGEIMHPKWPNAACKPAAVLLKSSISQWFCK